MIYVFADTLTFGDFMVNTSTANSSQLLLSEDDFATPLSSMVPVASIFTPPSVNKSVNDNHVSCSVFPSPAGLGTAHTSGAPRNSPVPQPVDSIPALNLGRSASAASMPPRHPVTTAVSHVTVHALPSSNAVSPAASTLTTPAQDSPLCASLPDVTAVPTPRSSTLTVTGAAVSSQPAGVDNAALSTVNIPLAAIPTSDTTSTDEAVNVNAAAGVCGTKFMVSVTCDSEQYEQVLLHFA